MYGTYAGCIPAKKNLITGKIYILTAPAERSVTGKDYYMPVIDQENDRFAEKKVK